jgi:hypothetical protein
MTMAPGVVVAGLRGSYRIEAFRGQGSFGVTYRARDESSGVPVIIKELRVEKLDDWKSLELFEREGRVLATLSHPNIPAFCDFFAHGGPVPLPVIAMTTHAGPERLSLVLVQELIEGATLQQRIDQGRLLRPDEAEAILRALLQALRHLHERTPPLVHRDIKPGNIVLSPEGQPHLVDFGAIQDRLRSAGSVGSTIVGTLGYMPMEQTRGDARPASDLYALGVTMVVALAGRSPAELPFDDATGKIAIDRALPFDTPRALATVLDAMVAPLLGQRVQSAEEALSRLDAGLEARRRAEASRAPMPEPSADASLERGDFGLGPRLVVVVGPNPGEQLALVGNRMTIGRAEGATLVIPDNTLSPLHCELRPRGAGGFDVKDLGASNGVRINGVAVSEGILEADDIIELGAVTLRLESSRADLAQAPPASLAGPPSWKALFVAGVLAVTLAVVVVAVTFAIASGAE